jgi:hypothetical protein
MTRQGTTSIRMHVDVDSEIGLPRLESILEVRKQFRGKMKAKQIIGKEEK